MPKNFFCRLVIIASIGWFTGSTPTFANASAASQTSNQHVTVAAHFKPRPSKSIRLDFDAWDFMLSETVLYMGPSTRTPASRKTPEVGSRLPRGNRSRLRLEGNKVLYTLMQDSIKSELESYATELEVLGNRLDIPALPKNEQLAYWINLHNAVLVTTLIKNYPGPKRQPSRIKPVSGSDAKLHNAKLVKIDGHALSLRDIREKIVFPNWKNKDVPFAFHLGHLSSPSLANSAYNGRDIAFQLARNAYEFVNSLRGYEKGALNPYIFEVSNWYYRNIETDLDAYFQRKMRPEVYTEFLTYGIDKVSKEDLSIADVTGGHGRRRIFSNVQTSARSRLALGPDIDDFLNARAGKFAQLRNKTWYKRGTVTIEDTQNEDDPSNIK